MAWVQSTTVSQSEEFQGCDDATVDACASEQQAAAAFNKPKGRFLCRVCGDRATGYNFGAIVCESCKSFYRRHAHRRPNFHCPAHNACQMNRISRRFCAACRLRKCFAVGMRVPVVVVEERRPPPEPPVITGEKLLQRRLLMARLLKRIAATKPPNATDTDAQSQTISICNQPNSRSESPSASASFSVSNSDGYVTSAPDCIELFDFDNLYYRVRAAAETILAGYEDTIDPNSSYRKKPPQEDSENACVRMAFENYIRAMNHFPELLQHGEAVLRPALTRKLLAQVNLYTMFAVSADQVGWFALDAEGTMSLQRFADYIEVMSREGINARPFIDAFHRLVTSLRAMFPFDWPFVLLTLCLIDLCTIDVNADTDADAEADCSALDELRKTYQSFLANYVERQYGSDYQSLLHFCLDEFPRNLEEVTCLQSTMLMQLPKENQNQNQNQNQNRASGANHLDTVRSASVDNCHNSRYSKNFIEELFEPIISQVTAQLTCLRD